MVGQAMGGHPFRQETLIPKGNQPQATTNPTKHPTGEQSGAKSPPHISATPFGRVLRDALLFADMAAGEERSYRHDAGFEIHSMDLCIEFAKAVGVEPCSDAYYEAINRLVGLSLPSTTEGA